jgi:metal-responsive CopG/Arc/MetJ family transcriptional regulator
MPKPEKIMVSIRLPRELLDRVDKFVKENTVNIQNRTHAIEVALKHLIEGEGK